MRRRKKEIEGEGGEDEDGQKDRRIHKDRDRETQ